MEKFDLLTNSTEEAKQIILCLQKIGCCVRCILRNLGELNPASFRLSTEELQSILLPEIDTSINECPCPGCLGILQKFAEDSFLNQILDKVKADGYQFSDHQCSLIVPVSLIVRQKALYVHLKQLFGESYKGSEDKIASVKDVWKWSCGYRLAGLLDATFQNRSQFDILMTFKYEDSDKECAFLLDTQPDTFRKRKQRKFGYETYTRANVAKALNEISDSKFHDSVTCPPVIPHSECKCTISCSHDAIFIAGRYQKYSRELSQTPWLIDGKRIMEGSVQELICDPILKTFKPTDYRLSSSGREDVDVRMLGIGRPFVVELINPHYVKISKDELRELQKEINCVSASVQVRDLQIVTREDTNILKEGETDKTKSYSAVCWCQREITEEDIQMLSKLQDLKLQQKTPLRVLHRRTAATRERTIHSMKITQLANNRFKLNLTTQAGTYVKEFVHGDFGRTSPNMNELLLAECDIIDLDVESVNVDWPPLIDPVQLDETNLLNHIESNNIISNTEVKDLNSGSATTS
ncbi:tRNA pseudouridine synthase Pus10-like [Physella acuta]|uniref:tRNA pseudouridine synthase Pus10-like n=1 Tax=Physella acuta TaxID=109671 RepID=UPI0027DC332C|nr:tRNA pseudouridine synthase Pus10-like [Physella acuta]